MTSLSDYEPLHIKYRPRTFDQVVGNQAVVKGLQAQVEKKTRPHAYLFTGPSGCGKTTLARIYADALGCVGRDFHESNTANYRGIDGARELVVSAARRPWQSEVSVFFLDECHKMTNDAQNAILKLLEEPPTHAYFILATTDPEKLLPTIKTRCMSFAVQELPRNIVKRHLNWIVEEEDCPEEYPSPKTISEIARVCNGSLRKAIMLLDQIIDIEDEDEAMEALVEAAGDEYQVIELCRALMKGQKWEYVQDLLKGLGSDAETSRLSILGYFHTAILNSNAENDLPLRIARHFTQNFYSSGKTGLALACYDALKESRGKVSRGGL